VQSDRMRWYEASGERHYYVMEVDNTLSIDARHHVRCRCGACGR
jgi:hypothetical protein